MGDLCFCQGRLPITMPSSILNISMMPELPAPPEDDVFACGTMYLVLDMKLQKPLVKRHTLQQLAIR